MTGPLALGLVLALMTQDVPQSDYERQIRMLSCGALQAIAEQQAARVIRYQDVLESPRCKGRELTDHICRGYSTLIIETKADFDSVDRVMTQRCGSDSYDR